MRIPIVVVAYNRPRSLARLLSSLHSAKYPHDYIDLIISIDKADDNQQVLDLAYDFQWEHGTKKVVYQEINLGLRKHILKCGNYSLEYGAVIVLEDDLYVSPNFYLFAEQALNFSKKETEIGGVSLYNHQLNVHTRENFLPHQDGYDNWYFQFASSWGQAWTKDQWTGFMDWYKEEPDIDNNQKVPSYVRSWSSKSWLKYNIAYLVEKDRYFLYPKISLTTNFSDAGTHIGNDSTIYQVPLDFGKQKEYSFSSVVNSHSVYDAYYENKNLHQILGLENDELCVDLFGYKPLHGQKYLLSSKVLDFKVIQSFGKSLKPHEDNVLQSIEGKELFLYDTSIKAKNPIVPNFERKIAYNYKQIPFKWTKTLFLVQSRQKFNNIIKRLTKKR
ncbi:MAG: glycosyltransferase [Allomuricauda sp.]